ncbi:DUF4974 domain-containing protein [Mucilaginibacter boryungensis]|uniref:DUF4974 domain-containing protein n=2 Tax=Mucilaginibacter boryungensis TaxID=768480 RepID=A0ABR9XHX5_9SPHI|nr:DUF4974 domain-containing protein [Mucilaginibacter boryungensis]
MAWYNRQNNTIIEWPSESPDEEEQIRMRTLRHLQQQIAFSKKSEKTSRSVWYRIAAAASIIITFSIGGYFAFHKSSNTEANKVAVKPLVNDIAPGSNKAILTLANGAKVVLAQSQNGLLLKQGSALVNKTGNGNLVYTASTVASNTAVVYNTLNIPYGGQYKVTLQDGTQVWLNAGSSLRYPTAFTGNERNVELSGEAYFEVAKNKDKPFIVSVHTASNIPMNVKVLGTHFNIMAYADEDYNATTLLEGSVKVDYGAENALLTPGRQAMLIKASGKLKTKIADTEQVIAWKNGYFLFDNDKIESIMRKISRWYDVEVAYKGDVSRKAIGGSVSRFKNVSEVLKMLELTGAVHFKIEGRRILVMP